MTPRDDRPLDLSRVDDLVVAVSFGAAPDEPADEVFLLTVHPNLSDEARFDDRPYVDSLEALLKDSHPPHTMQVTRTHESWGSRSATASIELFVGLEAGSERETLSAAVVDAFGGMLDATGRREPPAVPRDSAVELAMRLAALAWSDLEPGTLSITDEEHHHSTGVWTIGLTNPAHDRVLAQVGVVGGDPATARIKRMGEAEIVDSVGVEGP